MISTGDLCLSENPWISPVITVSKKTMEITEHITGDLRKGQVSKCARLAGRAWSRAVGWAWWQLCVVEREYLYGKRSDTDCHRKKAGGIRCSLPMGEPTDRAGQSMLLGMIGIGAAWGGRCGAGARGGSAAIARLNIGESSGG